jgi:uncharacterized membrane protein
MKNKFFNTRTLCRAGVIAALYVALTMSFGAIAYSGYVEIRPAEALTILPLFFPEAVPALYIGCMIANVTSPYWVYDVFIGSIPTLLAALCTYGAGRLIKNDWLKVIVGGFFPVLFNAIVIPFVIILCTPDAGMEIYWASFLSLAVTECIWVYALGIPLYFSISRLQKKGVRVLLPYNYQKSTEQ